MRHFLLIILLSVSTHIFAQSTTQRSQHFNLEKGVALQGYDPVAYFTMGKATKGKSQYRVAYKGCNYSFVSEPNKKLFDANPTQYEPQYGGWCAFAMGDYNKKVEINPETFKIVDGKLYLFYNAYFNNTLKSWNKDESNLKSKANKNWSQWIQ